VVRGWRLHGFVFEAFDRKGELRAIAAGPITTNLVAKLGGPDLRQRVLPSAMSRSDCSSRRAGLMPTLVQCVRHILRDRWRG